MNATDLGHGRGWLDHPAALSILRVDAALGHPLQITDAGRTNAEQWDMWRKYGSPRAAYPGTSTHESGIAIDTDERIALLTEHGWERPFNNPSRSPYEPWHYKYNRNADRHYGEDPDMALNADTDYPAFRDMLFRALKWDIRPNGAGPDWKLGPTIWERLNTIEAAAKAGVSIDPAEMAKAVADAIPTDIAADVVDALSKRLNR